MSFNIGLATIEWCDKQTFSDSAVNLVRRHLR